jgi:hypothetical protein
MAIKKSVSIFLPSGIIDPSQRRMEKRALINSPICLKSLRAAASLFWSEKKGIYNLGWEYWKEEVPIVLGNLQLSFR